MTDGAPPVPVPAPGSGSDDSRPVPGLHGRAVRASAWVLSSYPVGMGLQTLRSLILTRLLFPEAFGVMAMVGVVTNGLAMVSDVGISTSIVQNKDGDRPEFLHTAWTMQVCRGVTLWLLCCALAWPVSLFYEEPLLLWILPVTGFTSVIGGARATSISMLRRKLQLGRLQVFAFGNMIVELLAIVAFCYFLRSVWGLVLGSLVGALIYSVSSHTLLPGVRHRLMWHKDHAAALIRFGRWVLVSSLLTFLARQGDKLILGKLVDMDVLGLYSIGLVLAMMPRGIASKLSDGVLFPAASEKVRTDRAMLDRNVRRARRLLLRVGMLSVASVAIGAPVFFDVLYDPRYVEAGDMARLLVIPAWFAILQATTSPLLLALGDVRSLTLVNGVTFVATWAFAYAGHVLFGLPGFIVGLGAGQLAGEAVSAMTLARHGVACWRQDIIYSLMTAILTASAIAASALIRDGLISAPRWAVDVAIAAIWIGPLAAWMGRSTWREVFRR